MIYFSDLDRTLICSKKLISNTCDNVVCIEHIDNQEISYTSNMILEKIKILNLNSVFIPTTTRSIEQFKRINFEKFGITFKYAITSNGACILKDGEILESWNKHIQKLKDSCVSLNLLVKEYQEQFSKGIEPFITKFRIVEDNFFYFVLDKSIKNIDFLEEFILYIKSSGWTYFKNCSKVYFLPIGMTKENAIEFLIKNELNATNFNALGDSSMDIGMLNQSKKAYVPKHGDISNTFKHNDVYISNKSGLEGIDEILDNILNDLHKKEGI